MTLSEVHWDRLIPLPKLSPLQAKVTVIVVALLCFINSYNGDFVFDDSEAIVNNKDLRPTTPLGNLWRNDFWGSNLSSNSSHKSYRPLTVVTFRLNYLLVGGLHPVGFHVLNILLHAVISALMIDMFAILTGGLSYDEKGRMQNHAPKTSLLAALFFATHPVHTESVAGIVGRADLLCALFFQLSFLAYCKAFNKGRFSVQWVVASLLLCAAAMLCKEQGITVLGVNAAFDVLLICNVNVYELSQKLLLKRKTFSMSDFQTGLPTRLVLMLLGGLSMLYARWKIMGTGPPAFTEVDNPASFAENIFLRIVNYNYYYCLNAWLLVCPWWLCFDWSMGCVPLIKSAADWRMIWLLLLWCILLGLINQALCSPDIQRRRTLTLALVLLVVPFLPASNIFFRVGFVIAERVLYLSSAGYCLLLAYSVGWCCSHWAKYRKLVCVSMLALLCVYVLRCALRSHQWRSEKTLFTSALSVCPLNAKVHYNVGKNLADRGNTTAAVVFYREAVRLHPTYVHAMNNLGNILKERNALVEAEELLSKAVSIQPDFAAAWMNLGIVQNSLQKFEEAEHSYWNAIRFRKKYPDCYYNLGRLESEGFFLNALKINPKAASCHGNLAVLYHRWGKLEQAKKHYELSLKLDPEAPGTQDNYNMLRRKLDQLKRQTP
uniref:dolichyl-phosphate-mannose--protein mannosyltransferase n=1 Tax=Neogobius melanostomus TaxID=47308 RepID=A0A8C6SMQ6_9GOBI